MKKHFLLIIAVIVLFSFGAILTSCNESNAIACPSCGEDNPNTVKFCSNCGEAIIKDTAIDDSNNNNSNNSNNNTGSNDNDNNNDDNTVSVGYMNNMSIYHQDDGCFRFLFSLQDANKNDIKIGATVKIRIVNDLGVEVFKKTVSVTDQDFGEWENRYYGTSWVAAAIYIKDTDITAGQVSEGTFYYQVTASDGSSFDEFTLDIDNLPVKESTFGFNEKWIVNGEWELTILNAEVHRDCDANSGLDQYVLITYAYKNLGNKNSSGLAFTEYDFNIYDSNGNVATKCTCWDHAKSAEWIDIGASSTASVLVGFNSSTQTIKIVASHYDSNYNTIKATFNGTISTCIHSYTNGNCNEIAKCDICGASTGIVLGHDYSEATCTQAAKCSRCGQTTGDVSDCSFSDATCTTPETCTMCGKTRGNALGHNYNAMDYSKCTRCGETKIDYYVEYGFGDTFVFEDTSKKMEITMGTSASVVEVPDWIHKEEYCPSGYAVRVAITIKNIGTETAHISEFWDYKLFTTDGAEVINTTCFEYAYDDCLNSDDIRPNGTITKYIYFNYTGNGKYVIEFDATASNKITVVIDASKCEHVGDEGVCTACGKVTDAKLALACYIIKNGSKLSEGNRYLISKTIVENGNTMIGYIEFDYDNLEFVFSMGSEMASGADTFVTMDLDIGNSQKDVIMTFTSNGVTCQASGTILSNSFSVNNTYIYYFKCNSSSLSSELKSLLGKSTAGMLALCGQMIQETQTGVTISMLGIKNF